MKIKIFDTYYPITFVDKKTDVDPVGSDLCYGWINHDSKQIRIYKPKTNYPHTEVRKFIIHEILHILFREMDIDVKNDENAIIALSLGINTIIMDNPKLFKVKL